MMNGYKLPESPVNIRSDYKELKSAEIRKQNALNRTRARNMEIRIAKLLGGYRVPMSGAGSIKGDVIVPSNFGTYLVECKYTARFTKTREPRFTFPAAFLPKLRKDVKSMAAPFGILVFHFHDVSGDYVILDEATWLRINPNYKRSDNVIKSPAMTIALTLSAVKNGAYLPRPDEDYAIFHINDFIDAMDSYNSGDFTNGKSKAPNVEGMAKAE